MPATGRTAVVAVGGNALIADEAHKGVHDQSQAAAVTSHHIADMIASGWNVVVTHGSGPQVGFILRRSELAIEEVPPVPMDYAAADLQGAIGFMFQRALTNEMHARGIDRSPIAVVTQVLVDRNDPAFAEPSKPIGSHMDDATAHRLAREHGWEIREEPDRGWRRVVASPPPRAIVDINAIRHLVASGYIVIACGGGGIPVYEDTDGDLRSIEAVIDKDFASALLANELHAELLLITTEVEKVAVNFGRPDQQWLDAMTASEARAHLADGQFPPGSMGPKIEAVLEFIDRGGKSALITNPANVARALAGETGTRILPDNS